MKKITLLAIVVLKAITTNAQVKTDTVSIGTNYSNQVWYSLLDGVKATAPQNNWDLAFDASMMGAGIAINSANGTLVWKYPNGDTSKWNSVDTTGLSTWPAHWNGEQYWSMGAIGNYPDASIPFSVDWGVYDPANHSIMGTSLYVVKLSNGAYKKLWIQSLVGTTYMFKYADLDGSNSISATINKASFTGRNLCYYSLQNNANLNREPVSENWDLVFTAYTALFPVPHTEAGVLSNIKVEAAKCTSIANPQTYKDYQNADYGDSINVIGYDWKTGSGSSYTVNDSQLYFVTTEAGDIWKVIFTAFGGVANGEYIFTKEMLNGITAVSASPTISLASMALYPNPASGTYCNVVYSFKGDVASADVTVTDVTGKIVYADNIKTATGTHVYHLPLNNVSRGTYIVTIHADGLTGLQQRLVVQ